MRTFTNYDPKPLAGWSDASLTRVDTFAGWWAKRDDMAGYVSKEYPSGSKWRQYLRMAMTAPDKPMLVGLASAHSAMQIYVAAAAKHTGVSAIVYCPRRKVPTAATLYAIAMGAEMNYVPLPSWPSRVRSEARNRGKKLNGHVRWDHMMAACDAGYQCQNIPLAARRVVVPSGSGLTAAGVLAGLAMLGRRCKVVSVAVSALMSVNQVLGIARHLAPGKRLPEYGVVHAPGKYGDWVAAKLPDGTYLDPYYAAKAESFVRPGDCLWLPGLRPKSSLPQKCLDALAVLEP